MRIPLLVSRPCALGFALLAIAGPLLGALPEVTPGSKPFTIKVSAGTVEIDGQSVSVQPTTVTLAPQKSENKSVTAMTPDNYNPAWDNWLPWPGQNPKKNKNGAITYAPRSDENGVLILGQPYRQYPLDSIVVTSEDGAKTFVQGEDYRVFELSGQVANLDNGLGQPGVGKVKVRYQEVLQRLDLIQVDTQGKVSVKEGKSRFVCPYLPEPNQGCAPLAGVYLAPWQSANEPLNAEFILPIDAQDPVAPVNPDAVAQTRAKLEKGEPVSIAYMGDSLTLGAEAGQWWSDDTKHWRGRFQHTLKARYPDADISEIKAWQGGKGTEFGLQALKQTVLPAKPDLLIIMMGINDADGPSDGSRAKVDHQLYKQHIEDIVLAARQADIEVILMTSMQPYPMKPGGHADRWPDYVSAQHELATKHGVGLADTYAEWLNLQHRGIPPYSQLHNWNNHPGEFGHGVMADVPLRFFPGN
ncbi:SGNH/GDSL hydrolase family protein [Cerasicoccus fimbriatus]|uniref:SGNH/GDSL hydrolase family protein n=1 Tax=Cerasicoccus fimbriatus TaxID=3014554 RepID=UPI0022B45390|nr:GDSL-type esterase/lipase family protein [Cerasicoccus sp. TK19100]